MEPRGFGRRARDSSSGWRRVSKRRSTRSRLGEGSHRAAGDRDRRRGAKHRLAAAAHPWRRPPVANGPPPRGVDHELPVPPGSLALGQRTPRSAGNAAPAAAVDAAHGIATVRSQPPTAGPPRPDAGQVIRSQRTRIIAATADVTKSKGYSIHHRRRHRRRGRRRKGRVLRAFPRQGTRFPGSAAAPDAVHSGPLRRSLLPSSPEWPNRFWNHLETLVRLISREPGDIASAPRRVLRGRACRRAACRGDNARVQHLPRGGLRVREDDQVATTPLLRGDHRCDIRDHPSDTALR